MCVCCTVCVLVFFLFTVDAGLLVRVQYSEGPATGHLDTGFSWFPCVYKQMLRRFPTFQVATTCFSCSPPDLKFSSNQFHILYTCKITTAIGWQTNCNLLLLLLSYIRNGRLFLTQNSVKILLVSPWRAGLSTGNRVVFTNHESSSYFKRQAEL